MLEITADEPALWRMQVLERFDTRGWGVESDPHEDLPQPAAVPVTTSVEVRGLRNRLVASPGRITGVDVEGGGGDYPDAGEARQVRRRPNTGDRYSVQSEVVRATAAQLATVEVPPLEDYQRYTQIWPGQFVAGGRYSGYGGDAIGRRGDAGGYRGDRRRDLGDGRPAAELADGLSPQMAQTPWGKALRLAGRLSSGTTSELEIVRRVQHYLLGGDRFRYTTDVPEPGAQPLFDFLFKTHAGYCQQFAGAAALLLRMAGVPTRVVAGFATGVPGDDGAYEVRDEDAHAWIEVYFPGFGWVPFNPTPASAEAVVDPTLDVLAPEAATGGTSGGSGTILLVVPAALLLGGTGFVLRRRRRVATGTAVPVGELLARLVPGPVGPATTLSALRPELERIGPTVAALAADTERARFAAADAPPERHPHLRVWRALGRDVGVGRATVRMLRTAPRGPRPIA
ncbi:transglutaminaseTgpA domain-containing protein [Patulibacter sp. NPDC049589]|uniref:transglutaminase family protein n=1 Tax=Patulibacter sp. NPDC049589 TaxID=3154731 RepID=UPI0034402125